MLHKYITIVAFVLISALSLAKAGPPLQIEEHRGFPKSDFQDGTTDMRTFSPRYKLPSAVIPTDYDISLIPILTEEINERTPWTTYGSVRIYITCQEEIGEITIHKSADLNITHGSISVMTYPDNVPVTVLPDFDWDPIKEFYTIKLGAQLKVAGNYSVYIEFVAPIYTTGRLEGLYKSSYTNSLGVTSYLATTQFEPTDFRRLVPSFDEPNLKARFHIKLGRLSSKYQTLSNSELTGEPLLPIDADGFDGWVWDDYKDTVVMSTYLIAIVVTESEHYGYVDATAGLFGKPVRTYGPTELIETRGGGDFAADTAAKQLAYYEEYFEVPYAMHKMDSIAIPDFSAGAMENWGLNTYRIPYLLNFTGETTEAERGLISNILAHELAHQWFGNLVTCAEWTNLWLNEGFATYVSYLGWQKTDPEFDARKFFMTDAFQYSMVRDANPGLSHPIVNNAETTDEINSFFTAITYEKGGSLIRMMEGFLGAETLRKGLVRYLNDMNFKGALQNDLWRNLDLQAAEDSVLPEGVTVKQIMDTWTLQAGFPIVKVSVATSTRIFISQERVATMEPIHDLDPNNLWFVPIAIATQDNPNFDTFTPALWMEPQYVLKSHAIDTTKWVVVNPSASGYYRVLYDTKLTDLILAQLNSNHEVFSAESRSQFLDDYLTLAFAKHISIETALEFTAYLGKETERIGWGAALALLRNSFQKLKNTEAVEEFKKYLVPKLASTLAAIDLKQPEEQKGGIVTFRATLLDWACAMGYTECVTYANELLDSWVANPDVIVVPVPADIQSVMFCANAASGDAGIFEFLFGRYQAAAPGTTRKTRLLNSLACAEDEGLLGSLLAEVLNDPSRLTNGDKIPAILRVAAAKPLNVLTFLGANLEALKGVPGSNSIGRTLDAIAANLGTQADLTTMTTFINTHKASLEEITPPLPLDSYLTTISNNIAWRREYEVRMLNWFKSKNEA